MARQRTTKPVNSDDVRAQRSVEALKDAFLKILEEKPLDQISIKEITDTAGLSYPTFFRRFASKEDLLKNIATEEVRIALTLGQSAISRRNSQLSGEALCFFVQEHRQLWTALLTGGAASFVREEFIRIARELASVNPRVNPWLPLDLAVPFVTGGIFELLAWWLRQPEDYPIRNVVKLFNALIIDAAGRPRRITLE